VFNAVKYYVVSAPSAVNCIYLVYDHSVIDWILTDWLKHTSRQ